VPRAKSTTTARSASDDAIALLKNDHREVEQLFKKFESLGETAHKSRESTVAKIIEELAKHAAIEEQILYPEVRQRAHEDEDMVLEALEEHHIVKWTLSELEKLSSKDERYTAKVTVLMESVRHHIKEEEGELFPKVRKAFSRAELADMGERLRATKKAVPSRPHPRAPDEPPGNIVASALAAPFDVTAKVARGAAKAVRRSAG
jgi:hemerythrin superfamily protein